MQFGHLARHSRGTAGAQSWNSRAQSGQGWGIKLLGAQLGHNFRTKWRKCNFGLSWGTLRTHSGHTPSLDTVGAQLGHHLSIVITFNSYYHYNNLNPAPTVSKRNMCPKCVQTNFSLVCPEIVPQLCPNCGSTVPQLLLPQLSLNCAPSNFMPQLCPSWAREFSILCPNCA